MGLKRVCTITRARSVSDLTRDAMRVVLHGADKVDVMGLHMDEFRALLKNLDRKIDELAAGMTSSRALREN